jgi:CRISPR-associated endonuclease Csn1
LVPYLYRKKALDTKLEKFELGRTIFHLAQRRGYLSNRKQDLKDEETTGVVKAGIDALKSEMRKVGARTLGEYFCTVDPEKSRIRTRYTDRGMFQEEFRLICSAQRHLISPELEDELYKAIFFQRKLRSAKNLIGRCQIYPEERRCSYAKDEAQRFRIYSTLNHLRVAQKQQIRALTEAERAAAISVLEGFSGHLDRRGKITLAKLAKAVGLGKGEKFTLSDEEKDIHGNVLNAILYHVFGEKASSLTEKERALFFNDLNSIEKTEVLERRLRGFWQLPEDKAAEALKISLPDEYCAYSLRALHEMLPDLEAGIPLSQIRKLSYPTSTGVVYDRLPMLDGDEVDLDLRNPVVHRTLTELRAVVNAVIAKYGKPDRIRVELARDLKSSNKERERRTFEIRKREKARAEIAERIAREAQIEKPSRNDILKVMLADECNFTCPYTGKNFSMKELLYGKDIQIEHIIPYSRSFDDSFRNKTLCFSSANAKKNNRTPFEAFSGAEYEEILQRVGKFKWPFAEDKKDLFKCEKVDSEEFLARNLNDTRYASRLAVKYLGMLYGGVIDAAGKQRVFATTGGATAIVRRAWGANFLLGEGEKVRDDHRHHAIDALTIALTTPDIVKIIAGMPEELRRAKGKTPDDTIIDNAVFKQAKEMLDKAAVSHHIVNKLRGALHRETLYGKNRGGDMRHVRIGVDKLTVKDIPDIVDPVIKKLILERLEIDEDQISTITDKLLKKLVDTENPLFYRNKKGDVVNEIKAVRVKKHVTARTIGAGDGVREVANGANYLLAVFAVQDAQGNESSWEGEIVTLMDAVYRKQHDLPLFERERPGRKFKFTLKKGDIVKWNKDGVEQLCVIRGVSLPQFSCVPVCDARQQKELKNAKCWFTPTLSAAFAGKMTKYRMDILGELRRAND